MRRYGALACAIALLLDAELMAHPTGKKSETGLELSQSLDRSTLPEFVAFHTEKLVRASLPYRLLTASDAARMQRLSKRSLQRRLAAMQTSFEAIVDAVRADLALSYLRDSNLTVGQIAETLQFSETSALSRAVRRWHGSTPRALRRRCARN